MNSDRNIWRSEALAICRVASAARDWPVTCCPRVAIGRPPVAHWPRLAGGVKQLLREERAHRSSIAAGPRWTRDAFHAARLDRTKGMGSCRRSRRPLGTILRKPESLGDTKIRTKTSQTHCAAFKFMRSKPRQQDDVIYRHFDVILMKKREFVQLLVSISINVLNLISV